MFCASSVHQVYVPHRSDIQNGNRVIRYSRKQVVTDNQSLVTASPIVYACSDARGEGWLGSSTADGVVLRLSISKRIALGWDISSSSLKSVVPAGRLSVLRRAEGEAVNEARMLVVDPVLLQRLCRGGVSITLGSWLRLRSSLCSPKRSLKTWYEARSAVESRRTSN